MRRMLSAVLIFFFCMATARAGSLTIPVPQNRLQHPIITGVLYLLSDSFKGDSNPTVIQPIARAAGSVPQEWK